MEDVDRLLDEFLADVEADPKIVSPFTLLWYRQHIYQFRNWLHANRVTDPLSAQALKRFLGSLKQRSLSPYTLRGHVGILRRLGRWLVKEGYLDADPAAVLEKPRVPELLPKAVLPEDIERIIETARNTSLRHLAVVLFLRDTGVRAKELCGLLWKHMDLEGRVACVTGKNGKMRYVFFQESTMQVLQRYRESVAHHPDAPVFQRGSKPMTPKALRRLLRALAKKAGARGPVNPHAWRHAFGRDMTRAGCPTLALQDLMGHSAPWVTKIYSKLSPEQLQDVYDRYAHWEEQSEKVAGRRRKRTSGQKEDTEHPRRKKVRKAS